MKALISLGIAFFVTVLQFLIGQELTPALNVEMAGSILVLAFIGTAAITWLVLKYRQGPAAMIQRIPISLGVGLLDLAFLYVTCVVPNPRGLIQDAAIEIGVSAFLASTVTLVLLSLPARLSEEWRRAIISLGVAFFAAVFINVQIICFAEEAKNLKSTFAGVFIGTAVLTTLVLRRRSLRR